jgi:hypothetical protein
MTSERIREIQDNTAYPESLSVQQALLQVWNECEQEYKWIKVEDELPENQDIVFVKTDKGCYGTGYLHGKKSGFIVYGNEAYKEFGEVIEWRPINRL